jgi:hypothetical protein
MYNSTVLYRSIGKGVYIRHWDVLICNVPTIMGRNDVRLML